MEKKVRAKYVVSLKSDPSRRGLVLSVSRGGRTAKVQFTDYPRPTLHAVDGLNVLGVSEQLELFQV